MNEEGGEKDFGVWGFEVFTSWGLVFWPKKSWGLGFWVACGVGVLRVLIGGGWCFQEIICWFLGFWFDLGEGFFSKGTKALVGHG